MTAILGAQTREIAALRAELADMKEHKILGIPFWEGRLVGRRAVVARMASGKVNAAMITTIVTQHFRPSEIIVTGIAGGLHPDLRPGDIVIARQAVQHDMCRLHESGVEYRGARHPVLGKRGPVFLDAPQRLVEIAQRAAKQAEFIPIAPLDQKSSSHKVRVITGIVATGDAFVESEAKRKELREVLKADAVEMEGGAVAQVCYVVGAPWLVIRCISDLADGAAMADLETFADVAATNSARLVYAIVGLLGESERAGRP
ncbi:5'-methylthioadenosine/adenosylhomocysteine nucleosidase [Candidatus Sumerlaeota bacterium]|nr:5'-methylthioadenosine/adenosylhomocysteine nucleosidase [Candidatus Sumerlaeota bacterium]